MTTPRVPSPGNLWSEAPTSGAAIALSRLYWAYDATTDTWSLSSRPADEAGAFADITGGGTFVLRPLAAIPIAAARRRTTQRADVILFY